MHFLITHGYLLTGTGSNLYVNNLVREFCKAGHDVVLLCQDAQPEAIDYVSEVYTSRQRNTELVQVHGKATPYAGRCRVLRPDIEAFLPVYVYDHYDGFTVKEFPACSELEIQTYIDRNRQALVTALSTFAVDVIHTNHAIMFPYIVAQLPAAYRRPHVVTVHGSALNFSVKKDPRFVTYARAGFESADAILVDSEHACEELCTFFDAHEMTPLSERVQIIPAGVDVENFALLSDSRVSHMAAFVEHIQPVVAQSRGRTAVQNAHWPKTLPSSAIEVRECVQAMRDSYDYHHVDRDVIEKLQAIAWDTDRVVLFVGKYLWTKGLYLLLLAAPLILQRYPKTKFVLVGFGPFREIAELMVRGLAAQRLDWLLEVFSDPAEPLPLLDDNLHRHRPAIQRALQASAALMQEAVIFTGVIDHAHLKYLFPCSDVLVAPSVFPEAFGMVAVEALACGVLPLVTYQSAFREIADVVAAQVETYNLDLAQVPLSADACVRLAHNVMTVFAFQDRMQAEGRLCDVQQSLRTIATTHYSWSGIAARYTQVYRHARAE